MAGLELSTLSPSCQTGRDLSVAPWQLNTARAAIQGLSPLAFTKKKVNKMVEQIRVT